MRKNMKAMKGNETCEYPEPNKINQNDWPSSFF